MIGLNQSEFGNLLRDIWSRLFRALLDQGRGVRLS